MVDFACSIQFQCGRFKEYLHFRRAPRLKPSKHPDPLYPFLLPLSVEQNVFTPLTLPIKGRSETLLRDIISLADEATRLAKDAVKNVGDLARDDGGVALGQDADETEEEDFM
jgi:hypothetical protein